MADLIEKMKEKIKDMFDGDNQHTNIIDSIEDSMLDKNIQERMEEEHDKLNKED